MPTDQPLSPTDCHVSPRKAAFDLLTSGERSPAAALAVIRNWELTNRFASPAIYVSTAITSAGFVRPDTLADEWAAAKARNEILAARLYAALLANDELVNDRNLMMPTELGKVPGWGDTHYLVFYFAYAAGLSDDAAQAFTAAVDSHLTDEERTIADARDLTNDERWPRYLQAVTIMLEQLDVVRGQPGAVAHPPMQVLLQLVDTDASLGCQAESAFAEHERMDILQTAIELARLGDSPLGADLSDLAAAGGRCGRDLTPVMAVPKALNGLRSTN